MNLIIFVANLKVDLVVCSKRAREERALAVERRLLALHPTPSSSTSVKSKDGSDTDEHVLPETDQDRRHTMLEAMSASDIAQLKASAQDFADDFFLPSPAKPSGSASPSHANTSCDVQRLSIPGSSTSTKHPPKDGRSLTNTPPDEKRKGKSISEYLDPSRPTKKQKLPYGALVSEEVKYRKQEALGMTGNGRKLGETSGAELTGSGLLGKPPVAKLPHTEDAWACEVCTLYVYTASSLPFTPVLTFQTH